MASLILGLECLFHWFSSLFVGFLAIKASSLTKLLNFTSNVSAVAYFVMFWKIYWLLGLTMICGQIIRSTFTVRTVIAKDVRLLKLTLVVVYLYSVFYLST